MVSHHFLATISLRWGKFSICLNLTFRGHGDAVVTHSPPTSEVGNSNPRPYVGKLVVTYGQQFTVQKLDQLYVLVSSAHKTTRRDMTCTVLVSDIKPQINKKIHLTFDIIKNLLDIKCAHGGT